MHADIAAVPLATVTATGLALAAVKPTIGAAVIASAPVLAVAILAATRADESAVAR